MVKYSKMHFRGTQYTICYLLLSFVCAAVRVYLSNNNRNLSCGKLSSGTIIVPSFPQKISKVQVQTMELFYRTVPLLVPHRLHAYERRLVFLSTYATIFFHTRIYSLLRVLSDPFHLVASPKWIDAANTSIVATPLTCKRVLRF